MKCDKDFFDGWSKSVVEDGLIKVTKQGWKKFIINSKKRRRYIAEAILHAGHQYKINELLFVMGVIPEGKIILYDSITHKGIDFVVDFEEQVTAAEHEIEKPATLKNEIQAEGANAEIVDIEEVYKNTKASDSDSGIIVYCNGLCLDISDFEKLSVGKWLNDSTIDFFVLQFFYEYIPIQERDSFAVTKTCLLRDINLMINYESKKFEVPNSLKNALIRPLRGKSLMNIGTFIMPILSDDHFKLILVMHDKNSLR